MGTLAQNFYTPESVINQEVIDRYQSYYKTVQSKEEFNPSDGAVLFRINEVSIPGNSTIPVELTRWIPVENFNVGGPTGWDWDIPFIKIDYMGESPSNPVATFQGTSDGVRMGFNCTGGAETSLSVSHRLEGWGYHVIPMTYWKGKHLHIPGKTSEKFLVSTAHAAPKNLVTKSNYQVQECISAGSNEEGFIVKGPDGLVYRFDQIKRFLSDGSYDSSKPLANYTKLIMVSEISDQFGNKVNYNYDQNKNLILISSSDGRSIEIDYEDYITTGGKIKQRATHAQVDGKRWEYQYGPLNANLHNSFLHKVIRPDGTTWRYEDNMYSLKQKSPYLESRVSWKSAIINKETYQLKCHLNSISNNQTVSFNIETPTGLTLTYDFRAVYHGRSNVDPQIYQRYYKVTGGQGHTNYIRNQMCSLSYGLIRKVESGNGIPSYTWNYDYSENVGSFVTQSPLASLVTANKQIPVPSYGLPSVVTNRGDFRTVKEVGANTTKIYYIDRRALSPTEGMVVVEDIEDKKSGRLVSRKESTFVKSSAMVGQDWFIPSTSLGAPTADSLNRDQIRFRINLQHEKLTFYYPNTSLVDRYTKEYLEYDNYGNIKKTYEHNNFSVNKRYHRYSYINDVSNWRIGIFQHDEVSADNTTYKIVNLTVFNSAANNTAPSHYLPYELYYMGAVKYRYPDYHNNGQLKKIISTNLIKNENRQPVSGSYQYQIFDDYYRGVPRTITFPSRYNSTTTISYKRSVDYMGNITSITDLNGITANYIYDAQGYLKAVDYPSNFFDLSIDFERPEGAPHKYTQLKCIINTTGDCIQGSSVYINSNELDARYRIRNSSEQDISNNTQTFVSSDYNDEDALIFSSLKLYSPNNITGTQYEYDALGRPLKTVLPNGGFQIFEYLPGNKVRTIDPMGYQTVTTFLSYSQPEREKPILIESPESVITAIDYNLHEQITQITQSGPSIVNGVSTSTEYRAYDSRNNLCKTSRADVGTTRFEHDSSGLLLWSSSYVTGGTFNSCDGEVSESKKIHYVYDNMNDIWVMHSSDSNTPDRIYSRDNNGNILNVSMGNTSQVYEYNQLNKVTSESISIDQQLFKISYGYDLLGNVNEITYPNKAVVLANPNAFGASLAVTRKNINGFTSATYASDVTYHPNGSINTFQYGNGIAHKIELNQHQQLTSIRDSNISQSINHLSYTYNLNSKISSISNHVDDKFSLTHINYDGLGRITSYIGKSSIGNGNFSYDSLGNIMSMQDKVRRQTMVYSGSTNRLVRVDSTGLEPKSYPTFAYDLAGNITNNGMRMFSYNLLGQMTNSGNNSYIYDNHNRRIMSNENGKKSYSVYNHQGRLMFVQTPNGSVNYVYLGSRLIAKDGTFKEKNGRSQFGIFGAEIGDPGNDVGFTGHKFDAALGLNYMQARYYDPNIGRFYSNDPVGFLKSNVFTFNRYSYVGNDPVNMVDPTGEFGVVGALIGAGIEAGLQLAANGKITDWKAVGAAGAVGAVTGGIGGRLATQALQGTISASRAVATTAAVGGAANGVGTVASNAIDGKATTATEVAVAVAGGAAGAGAGAKIANQVASKLDDLGKSGGLGQHIADTTRASFGGGAAEKGASLGEGLGNAGVEAAANLAQKKLNEEFK